MNVRYRVELSQIERNRLAALLSGGKHASRKIKRAQILLAADAGASDEETRLALIAFLSSRIFILVDCRTWPLGSSWVNSAGTRRTKCHTPFRRFK
jgi:hypothetical protein